MISLREGKDIASHSYIILELTSKPTFFHHYEVKNFLVVFFVMKGSSESLNVVDRDIRSEWADLGFSLDHIFVSVLVKLCLLAVSTVYHLSRGGLDGQN